MARYPRVKKGKPVRLPRVWNPLAGEPKTPYYGYGPGPPIPVVTLPTGGGGGGTVPPAYPGYLSPAQIRAQALAEANLATGATSSEYKLLRAQELARAMRQAQAIRGFAQAAAQMMQGAGAQTLAGYQSAAQQTSSFAKGFSDATAHLANQNADEQNARLQGLGSTQTVHGDQGAANVLYGVGGYIPASTLEREGAAYSAQAQAYPQATLGAGQNAFKAALAQGETAAQGYDARLAALGRQRTGTVANYIFREKQRQAQLEQQAINTAVTSAYHDAQIAHQQRVDEYNMGYLAYHDAKTKVDQQLAMDRMLGYSVVNGKKVYTEAYLKDQSAQQHYANVETESHRHNVASEGLRQQGIDKGVTKNAASIHAKSVKGRSGAWKSLDTATVSAGKSGLGKPVKNPNFGKAYTPGKDKQYLTPNGEPTNDPKLAARSGRQNGDAILTQIYQGYGTALTSRYGVPKEQVLARIKARLRKLGYKV